MPARVYRGKSAYEWRPKGGGAVRLCGLDASRGDVWRAFEEAVADTTRRFTVTSLKELYFDSANFTRLAANTRRDYAQCWEVIAKVFGESDPESVETRHVRQYMDLRGKTSQVRANRERALMSNIFAWGFERGMVALNPCAGVKPFPEKARDRYVTDDEYRAVLAIAPPNVRAAMEIAYRCAARQQDVLALLRQHLLPDGIYIKQGKTGKQQIKEWSPELRAAVDLAVAQPSTISSTWVIHTNKGQRYTRDGFNSIWSRTIKRAVDDGIIIEGFTFHDLKRKGISDFEGDKQTFSGHKTRAMAERYSVKPALVPTIGSRKK